jgi:hypothetical protein
MISIFIAAAFLFQATQQAAQPASPVSIVSSQIEVQEHALDSYPFYVRLKETAPRNWPPLTIDILVDPSGTVVSATPVSDVFNPVPDQFVTDAEALARALRFRPFERDSRTVTVKFPIEVHFLQPDLTITHHVSFPRIKEMKSLKITLVRRMGIFGQGPGYSLEIHGDGSVIYRGKQQVTFLGEHHATVSQEQIAELIHLLKSVDYFSLPSGSPQSEGESWPVTTSIEIDGKSKQVNNHGGFETMVRVEDAIDRICDSARWTKGNAETVAALKAEHWDFHSAEAARSLVRVANRSDAGVVNDLLEAGVPLTGYPYRSTDPSYSPALFVAAGRGDVAMMRVLLEAGAGTNPKVLDLALGSAASSGNLDAFRLLAARGASSSAHYEYNRTLLIAAAESGSPEMVKEVFKNHVDVNASMSMPPPPCTPELQEANYCGKYGPEDGRTALMQAVSRTDYRKPKEGVDRVEVVRLLLAAGADVNARDRRGNTAVILCEHNPGPMELLLKAGADPNATNNEGRTAMIVNYYNNEAKAVLMKYGAVDGDIGK